MLLSNKVINSQAPKKAKGIAGKPNFRSTALLIFLKVKLNLKILFKKWTIAVIAIATSIGKNKMNAGVKMVPTPNPEKKVSNEVNNATKPMMKYSILS